MNERIKELATKAGLPTYNPEGLPTKLEKFAELIVLDICDAFDKRAEPNTGFYEPHEPAKLIKQHFGHVDGNDTFLACVDKVGEKRHEPLTDEEILNLARNHYNPHQRAEISFARAIEAAHGIKE